MVPEVKNLGLPYEERLSELKLWTWMTEVCVLT